MISSKDFLGLMIFASNAKNPAITFSLKVSGPNHSY